MPPALVRVRLHPDRKVPLVTRPRFSPRFLVLALVAALCSGLLVLVGSASYAAPFGRLHPPSATPIAGVPFKMEGWLSSKLKRPVQLQVQRGKSWKRIASAKTTTQGTFAFARVVLVSTSNVRVVAPAYKVKKKSAYKTPRITSKAIRVAVTAQESRIQVVPPVVQQGALPAVPAEGVQVVARFTPARADRPVRLEAEKANGWVEVARGVQDASGHVAFLAPGAGRYRAVAEASGGAAEVVTSGVSTRTWNLALEDQFNGDALNPALWVDQDRPNGSTDLRTCSRIDPAAKSVSGGALNIGIGYDPTRTGQTCDYVAAKGPGSYPYLINSQVATEKKFDFTHGVAAARMKLQQAQGMHSGFWLQPAGQPQAGNPASGVEIDVMEFFGQTKWDKDGVGAFIHWVDAAGDRQKFGQLFQDTIAMKPVGDTWWDSYHVFSVEWTPTEYIFRVDGREYYRENRAVSTSAQYLIFSMLTSNYELEHLTADEITQTAQVDWVRVWSDAATTR